MAKGFKTGAPVKIDGAEDTQAAESAGIPAVDIAAVAAALGAQPSPEVGRASCRERVLRLV